MGDDTKNNTATNADHKNNNNNVTNGSSHPLLSNAKQQYRSNNKPEGWSQHNVDDDDTTSSGIAQASFQEDDDDDHDDDDDDIDEADDPTIGMIGEETMDRMQLKEEFFELLFRFWLQGDSDGTIHTEMTEIDRQAVTTTGQSISEEFNELDPANLLQLLSEEESQEEESHDFYEDLATAEHSEEEFNCERAMHRTGLVEGYDEYSWPEDASEASIDSFQRKTCYSPIPPLPPAFPNESDYPPGWNVYHSVLGVVLRTQALEYDEKEQKKQRNNGRGDQQSAEDQVELDEMPDEIRTGDSVEVDDSCSINKSLILEAFFLSWDYLAKEVCCYLCPFPLPIPTICCRLPRPVVTGLNLLGLRWWIAYHKLKMVVAWNWWELRNGGLV